jgi:hypothetical protein
MLHKAIRENYGNQNYRLSLLSVCDGIKINTTCIMTVWLLSESPKLLPLLYLKESIEEWEGL